MTVPDRPASTFSRRRRVVESALDSLYASYWELRHLVRANEAHDLRSGSRLPVLLLPGVYETWEFLRPVGQHLNRLGHPIHVVPGFGLNRRSIPEMAALAAVHLDTLGLDEIAIVGHSKGGLIAKYLMVADAQPRVSRLVAVNTPFAGSSFARWALRPTLREFAPLAPTLAALAAESAVNERIVSIFSESDPIIPGGSELPGAAANVRLPLVGHFRLLSSPLLFDAVEEALELPGADEPADGR